MSQEQDHSVKKTESCGKCATCNRRQVFVTGSGIDRRGFYRSGRLWL